VFRSASRTMSSSYRSHVLIGRFEARSPVPLCRLPPLAGRPPLGAGAGPVERSLLATITRSVRSRITGLVGERKLPQAQTRRRPGPCAR
jgi:hypothetical protein